MYTSTGSDKQFFWKITHFFYAIDCYPLRRFYSIVIRLRRYLHFVRYSLRVIQLLLDRFAHVIQLRCYFPLCGIVQSNYYRITTE